MKNKPLTKRVAEVLEQKRVKKAQDEMAAMPEKVDPRVKALDHLYESLSDEDLDQSFHALYRLTTALDLQDDVAFEVQEETHLAPKEEEKIVDQPHDDRFETGSSKLEDES